MLSPREGLNGKQEPLTRIEEMAAYYIKEIQTIQPQGPYLLGGRCMGGKIAFEIAQQLLAQEQQVLLLALVESPRVLKESPAAVNNINKNIERMLDFGIRQASSLQKIMKANMEAASNYKEKVYPGQMASFCAANKHVDDQSLGFGWGSLVTGKLNIYEVPGNHLTIDEEPYIQVLAEKLSNCLNDAEVFSQLSTIN